jgi:hypothetical protein
LREKTKRTTATGMKKDRENRKNDSIQKKSQTADTDTEDYMKKEEANIQSIYLFAPFFCSLIQLNSVEVGSRRVGTRLPDFSGGLLF